MATVATSGNPRPPGARMANSDGTNTISGRGLAHLVSKYETLDKGKPSFPHQLVGLPTSKTVSSLSSLQDNRPHTEKGYSNNDGRLGSSTGPSPVAAAAAALRWTSISPTKPKVAPPSKSNPKDRVPATVAEKRRIFETDESSLKDAPGAPARRARVSVQC